MDIHSKLIGSLRVYIPFERLALEEKDRLVVIYIYLGDQCLGDLSLDYRVNKQEASQLGDIDLLAKQACQASNELGVGLMQLVQTVYNDLEKIGLVQIFETTEE